MRGESAGTSSDAVVQGSPISLTQPRLLLLQLDLRLLLLQLDLRLLPLWVDPPVRQQGQGPLGGVELC